MSTRFGTWLKADLVHTIHLLDAWIHALLASYSLNQEIDDGHLILCNGSKIRASF